MPDDIRFTRQLLDDGFTPDELARLSRRGGLVRVRRGAYAEPADELGRVQEHLRLVRATAPQCSPAAVISHQSAAALHDLPVWTDRLRRVQLTRDRSGGSKRRRHVEIHGIPLPDCDITVLDDLRVTTMSRTVLDVACVLPTRLAVAIGDAALRRGVTPAELEIQLEQARGRTGIVVARRTVPFLDARSESPGESVSRADLAALGVAPTELQFEVFDDNGNLVGRSDFAWPQFRTLGEYDGRGKYGELRRHDETAGDVVWAEKGREDRLRDLGWQVVRWTWDDLQHPERLLARLRRAFARGLRTP